MDFVQQALWLALIPLALVGVVGVLDVTFFKGLIGVKFAALIGR